MVKAADFGPRFCVVASFASKRRAVRAPAGHSITEFAVVRVAVAACAAAILEMEWKNFVRSASGPNFVAICARDGNVRTGQREARHFVLRDGVRRAVEAGRRVA